MLRAAAWTGGLFAVGGGIVHLFPGQFTEPLVLVVLGATLWLVSGRAPRPAPSDDVASSPVRATERRSTAP